MRTRTKRACLLALCVAQGCLPGRWHPAGGDAGDEAVTDAPVSDTPPADVVSDAPALDAHLDAHLDALPDALPDASLDAAAPDAPDVLRPDVPSPPDAPADVASDVTRPDVPAGEFVTAVFSRTTDLCATLDTGAGVELQLTREPADTRTVTVRLTVTGTGFSVSPTLVSFTPTTDASVVRVTAAAGATGAFTLTATPDGSGFAAVARGSFAAAIAGAPDCSFGPRGYAEAPRAAENPRHNSIVSLDLSGAGPDQSIVTLGMSHGSRIGWYNDVSADWSFRRITSTGLPDRTFGTDGTGFERVDTSNYRPGLSVGQEHASRVRVWRNGSEYLITGVGYGRLNDGANSRGQMAVARLRASGDRDDRFREPSGVRLITLAEGSNHELTSFVPLNDGSVLAAGFIGVVGFDDRFTLERISAMGVRLRATTTSAVAATEQPRELVIAPPGRRARRGNIALDRANRVVVAGTLATEPLPAFPLPPPGVGYIARLTPAGTPDATFGATSSPGMLVIDLAEVRIEGRPVTEVHLVDVAELPDRSYVVAGTARASGRSRPVLVHVSSTGGLVPWSASPEPVLVGDCAGATNGGYEALAVRSTDGAIVAAGACRDEDVVGDDSLPGTNTLISCFRPTGAVCAGFGAPDRPGTYIEDLSACGPDPSVSCFDAAYDVRFDAVGRVVAAITALRGTAGYVFDGTDERDLVRTGGVLRLFGPARVP